MNMYHPKNLIKKRTGQNWKYNRQQDDIIKTETIPGNIYLGNYVRTVATENLGACSPFTANPIKHWRKQRVNITQGRNDIVRSKILLNYYEVPGGATTRNINATQDNCNGCLNTVIPADNITYQKKGHQDFFDLSGTTDYVNECPPDTVPQTKCVTVCDPEHKARMRTRYPSRINKDTSKPKYFTTNSSYLQARCRTYTQNNFQYGNVDETKCGNLNDPQAFRPNCVGCLNCNDNGCNKVSYYKPNNCKFAVQGGVSSAGRTARLKLDTITKFASGFNNDPNFGPNVANAYAYSGRSDAPYTIKNKNFVCATNLSKFRRTGARQLRC